jgi:hypothetical protein
MKLFKFLDKKSIFPNYNVEPSTVLDLIQELRKDKFLFLDIFGTFKIKRN